MGHYHSQMLASRIAILIEQEHDKNNERPVHPTEIQISLDSHQIRSESSLCALWVAKDPNLRQAESEDTDQTVRMPRQI